MNFHDIIVIIPGEDFGSQLLLPTVMEKVTPFFNYLITPAF